jgi:hypothetical protein
MTAGATGGAGPATLLKGTTGVVGFASVWPAAMPTLKGGLRSTVRTSTSRFERDKALNCTLSVN